MRPALLVAAWTLVCALATGAAGLVRPSELFMPPGSNIALLPEATMVGIVEADLQGVASAEACAEQCRGLGSACDFMAFCTRAVSVWAAAIEPLRCPPGLPPPPPLPLQYRPFPGSGLCCPASALQGGCSTQAYGAMDQGDCLLLSRNCTLPADREAAEGVVSGGCRLYWPHLAPGMMGATPPWLRIHNPKHPPVVQASPCLTTLARSCRRSRPS